jgi:ABC-type polysaccharide/polyol phosphate export permease
MVPSAIKPILYLNPLSYFVISFQHAICYGQLPPFPVIAVTTLMSMIIFAIGFDVFKRAKTAFFDFA